MHEYNVSSPVRINTNHNQLIYPLTMEIRQFKQIRANIL